MTAAAQQFGRVAVLMGGRSAEREISLISGQAVLDSLRKSGIKADAFDPAERDFEEIRQFDRAFIVLHGRGGEDGTVQGALEIMDVPYTGSGVMSSALCLDKWRTKLVWDATGIPTPRHVLVESEADIGAILKLFALPVVVKPVHEGSTIGITKVTDPRALPHAIESARRLDDMVMVEEFVSGQELTAAILNGQPLPLVRIEAPEGNYDYQNKYFSDETRYFCPSGIDAGLEARIQADALRAFQVLGCRDWARADLIVRPEGDYQFLEMNTVPGMTGHSLVPMAAREAGIDFDNLVIRLLCGTMARGREGQKEVAA